jgi:hypothetical protein
MNAHPTVRLLHDLGAATWFGGSLMGATGLNGAAAQLDDPTQRARASTAGWSRWAPVAGAGVVAHLIGSAGLTATDWPRVRTQEGVARAAAIKTALTVAGAGVSVWSAALNRSMAAAGPVPVRGATEPGALTPDGVAATQAQLKAVQWLNPLLAGSIIGVGSWMSEQQRTAQVAQGVVRGALGGRLPVLLPTAAAVAFGVMKARKQRRDEAAVTAYPAPALTATAPTATAPPSAPPYATGATPVPGTTGAVPPMA